jgi:uncharacterized protein DUF4149
MTSTRVAAWLSGLWAGLLWGVGLIGAPAGFATTTPDTAGRVAARMFMQEAYLSLVLAAVLFLMLRKAARIAAEAGDGSVFDTNMLLVLGTLFCTVAGYFAVQPMMAAARAGQGSLSFAALHGISAGLYLIKAVLVSVLAWRLARR